MDLFTADTITAADIEVLKLICARCDVALLCWQYAKASKAKVGFWAGKNYGLGAGRTQQKAA
ncbi:WhiB family transcriptional regulator [Microbacterium sp.]|uniref:WhiB family transcriptional regulator n=1 Tax=Microbacterium sp. TaxID=51671 RepID=UPI003A8D620F